MFQLHDLRRSRVWQEAYLEEFKNGFAIGFAKGFEEGFEKGWNLAQRELIQRLIAKEKSMKEIADFLELPLAQIRRAASR